MVLFNKLSVISLWFAFFLLLFGHVASANTNKTEPSLIEQKVYVQEIQELNRLSKAYLNISLDTAYYISQKAIEIGGNVKCDSFLIESYYLHAKSSVLLGRIDTALSMFKFVDKISSQHGAIYWRLLSQIEIGEIYYNLGRYHYAYTIFNDTYYNALSNNFPLISGMALHFMGKYYHTIGEFKKSVDHYQRALKILEQTSSAKRKAYVYNDLGKHFDTRGEFAKAIDMFMLSLNLLDEQEDKVIRASSYNHIGNIYQNIGQYDKALEYHQKALQVRRKINYEEGIAKSLKNLGELYIELGNDSLAQVVLTDALDICEKIGYRKGSVKSLNNLGEIAMFDQQFMLADERFKKALWLSRSIGYDKGTVRILHNMGKLYNQQNKTEQARGYYMKSLGLADSAQIKKMVLQNYDALYKLNEYEGEYENALKYLRYYLKVNNQLINAETGKKIAEMQVKYNIEKKEKENLLLKKENEIQQLKITRKNALILVFALFLVTAVLLIMFFYNQFRNKQKANKQLAKLNEKILHQNREHEKLNNALNKAIREKDKFFGIIAHELRNPLWWFRNLTDILSKNFKKMSEEKVEHSINALDESAKNAFHLMDNLLQWSRSQLNRITFHPEHVHVAKLIDENIKLSRSVAADKGIKLETRIDREVYVYVDKQLINTVLRNLLFNALKYTPEGGHVMISTCLEKETCIIQVSDNGVGIAKDHLEQLFDEKSNYSTLGISQEKGSGIGLVLCKEFVHKNGGEIYVESVVNHGTVFSFSLPLSKAMQNNYESRYQKPIMN